MATRYKTPGVYVEEVSVFPPSIAQVETAVPAFLGYTAKASQQGEDRTLKPTRITSLAEFDETFGRGPGVKVKSVQLDLNNNVTQATLQDSFPFFDSLRLFFANGGGRCYIVSLGPIPPSTSDAEEGDFMKGLAALEKEDEPTLIVMPDAVALGDDRLYNVQQAALAQAAKLGDRFVVCDPYPVDPGGDLNTFAATIDDFRDKIGIEHLSYGAAYGPYLKANLNKKVSYRDVAGRIQREGGEVSIGALAEDPELLETLGRLENAIADVDAWGDLLKEESDLTAAEKATASPARVLASVEKTLMAAETSFRASLADDSNDLDHNLNAYEAFLHRIFEVVQGTVDTVAANQGDTFSFHTPGPDEKKKRYLRDDIITSAKEGATLRTAVSRFRALAEKTGRLNIDGASSPIDFSSIDFSTLNSAEFEGITAATPVEDYYPVELHPSDQNERPAQIRENLRAGVRAASNVAKTVLSELDRLTKIALEYEHAYEDSLLAVFPLLKTIINRAANAISEVPPSGAIVGVYSAVDANRGVFKAPANVSLRSVVGVTEIVSHEEQQDYNVDVVAGKSVNIIRPFSGKGILVWGARTLAGNDNEWRFIPVRRFFNMVEESCKKATEGFVFEPNDANTWVKVKTMVENFLNNQWRSGALAGADPDDAYFVKIGLGQTMTAQDVLEGRMIVEIGLAVVRPAEFIILRFSHKMQQS